MYKTAHAQSTAVLEYQHSFYMLPPLPCFLPNMTNYFSLISQNTLNLPGHSNANLIVVVPRQQTFKNRPEWKIAEQEIFCRLERIKYGLNRRYGFSFHYLGPVDLMFICSSLPALPPFLPQSLSHLLFCFFNVSFLILCFLHILS